MKSASIVLARRYAQDGTSKLRVVTAVPQNTKYEDERIDDTFKGKKGKELGETLLAFYPEATDALTAKSVTTQKAAKEIIQEYVSKLPADKLVLKDIVLPTGIDNSIRSILPEPVYIPAVKDFSDELKTKESASFGKLLNILLDVIEDDLTEAAETFENLRKKLNRVTDNRPGRHGNELVLDAVDGANRIQKLADMPRGCQRASFRFSVTHHGSDDKVGIVERGSAGVREDISQFTTFVNRARSLRRTVAANSAGERELFEEFEKALFVLALFWVDFTVGAFQIDGSKNSRRAVTRTREKDHLCVMPSDEATQVGIDKGEPGLDPQVRGDGS